MLQLLGKESGPIGFGLMGLTWREKPCSQEQAFETMRSALEQGCQSIISLLHSGLFPNEVADLKNRQLLERWRELRISALQ
ncbi:hypothetical protein B0I35DRAFT_447867 [Stachybotrys elegans]|uniref:NADP-dependent oxidoreductase domain-containing protein n=1 Tax=Stachybotrys elegans TaxID=80388 RepID=A0A8K0SCM7_9HYPO|nr:hypothetical protein B0I35DRAFT_447867 [Stachybotrys elegans]